MPMGGGDFGILRVCLLDSLSLISGSMETDTHKLGGALFDEREIRGRAPPTNMPLFKTQILIKVSSSIKKTYVVKISFYNFSA